MELGIPNAPATGLTQQDNTGYAAVLDNSTFDPITFISNYGATVKAEKQAKAKAELERAAKWKNYDYKSFDPKDIYWSNEEELKTTIDELSNIVATAAAGGKDPDSPEFQRTLSPSLQRLTSLQLAGKGINEYVGKLQEKVASDPAKYDPEEYKKWFEGLKAQPNVRAREEYIQKNQPFTEKFDFLEVLPELLPEASTFLNADGSGVEKLNRDDTRAVIEANVTNPNNKAKMARVLEEGIAAGHYKDSEGMIDYFTDLGIKLGGKKEIKGGGGGMNISFGGNGASTNNYKFTRIEDENFIPTSLVANDEEITRLQAKYDNAVKTGTDFLTEAENARLISLKKQKEGSKAKATSKPLKAVSITYKGGDDKPITLIGDNNKDVSFVPTRFIHVTEGGKDFWRVEGKRGKTSPTYTKTEVDNALKEQAYGSDAQVIDNGDGTYKIVTTESETSSIPLTDANKRILTAHLENMDIDRLLELDKAVEADGATPSTTPKKKKALPQ